MTKRTSTVEYRCIADVEITSVDWLWKGRFAKGKVSIIAGHPGLGKSQITISIAAIVSLGEIYPLGDESCQQGGTIFLSAEDDASDTIRPRLEAAGANLNYIYILDAIREPNKSTDRSFEISRDLDSLGNMIESLNKSGKAISLIFIDPISAYLGDVNSHNNAEVRHIMKILGNFALKYHVSIIGISHLNKNDQSESITRVSGSMAFIAAARTAFMVVKDIEDRKKVLFLPIKNNLYCDKSGLSFRIESYLLECGIETSRVMWNNEVVSINIDDVMLGLQENSNKSALDDAKDFLLTLLANGPIPSSQIPIEVKEAGLAMVTVRRAKDELKIQIKKEGMNKGWVWILPANSITEDNQ